MSDPNTLRQRLLALDDGESRPVTMLERQVCGRICALIDDVLAEAAVSWDSVEPGLRAALDKLAERYGS